MGLEIYANILNKPDIPSEEEMDRLKYEYRPVPSYAKLITIPAHALLEPGPHLDDFWLDTFPKKLEQMLIRKRQQECIGWGIQINESWNKRFISAIAFLVLISFALFVTLYSIITGDRSTGAGIGSFLVALFTVSCWFKYEGWKVE